MAVVYHDEARRLRALAVDPGVDFAFWRHAEIEMRKDRIDRTDILSICKRGSVIRNELHRGSEWRWTAQGRDCDGRLIEVVVIADEQGRRIDVVSAWAVKR